MANIFRIDRATNTIVLGTAATDIFLTPMTAGSILFAGASGLLSQDNTGLFYKDASNRLGLGTDDPGYTIDMRDSSGDDYFTLNHDGNDANIRTNDGVFYFRTDETNANGSIRVIPNGSGWSEQILYANSNIYSMQTRCQSNGQGLLFMSATAGSPGDLSIQHTSLSDIRMFSSTPEGQTRALKIWGWRTGAAAREEVTFSVGVDAEDTLSVKGLSNYSFDGNLILPKTSGIGIKVDTASPTFGFADLLGDQFSKNTGGTKPTLTAYNGAVDAWQFSNGDEAFLTYHIPHDYVAGTDIHLHIHWSQNNAGATGGTIDFKYFAIYAKGHNQASGSVFTGFSGNPITATFSSIDINDGGAGLTQYQQHLTEVTISAASATAALFNRDDFEPDGVIELTLEMDANNLTGTPSDPFIHYADIHYQTNGIIGTKSRTPDFYA